MKIDNNKIEEIVTYEIFQKNSIFYIKAPINGLIKPKFLIKEDEKSLYIFVFNYTVAYVIKELSPEVIQAIKKERCYLVEGLLSKDNEDHHISLEP